MAKKVDTSVRKAKSSLSEKKTSRARRLGRRAFGAAVADESSTSAMATAAACGETPGGRSSRAMSKARWRACGSARSCIQPCSSHSLIAPASFSTAIAQPRKVQDAGRFSLVVISIFKAPAWTNPFVRPVFRALSTEQGFAFERALACPRVPLACQNAKRQARASSFHRGRRWSTTSAPCSKAKLRIASAGASPKAPSGRVVTECGRSGQDVTQRRDRCGETQARRRETAPAARGDPLHRSASAQTNRSPGSPACDHGSARPVRWPGQ